MRHWIERGIASYLLGVSLGLAYLDSWSPASYFLLLAALVDFDDWSQDAT